MTGRPDEEDGCYDAALPILAELERAVTTRAQAVADERHAAAARPPAAPAEPAPGEAPPAPRRARGRALPARPQRPSRREAQRRSRQVRRALVLGGIAALVGGTAAATRLVGGDAGTVAPDRADRVLLARAPAGAEEAWRLEAYVRGTRICLAFATGATEVVRCTAPPAPRGLVVQSAADSARRYVFGLAGADVARVRVRVGDERLTVPARRVRSERLLVRAAAPNGLRVFVASPARTGDRDGPARVQALTATGRAAGPTRLDCSLGTGACRR